MAWTVDELLAGIKLRAGLPTGSNLKMTDAEILSLAYSALITSVESHMTNLREEYGITHETVSLTAGTDRYVLPERAISGTIRQVLLVDPTGKAAPLFRLNESEAWAYDGRTGTTPDAYCIEDSTIRVLPKPTGAGYSLKITYKRRPSTFVPLGVCHRVDFLPNVLTVTTSGPATTSTTRDIVRAAPPFGMPVQGVNAAASGSGTVTFVFGAQASAGMPYVSVGDYVCLANTTCIVPVPERFQQLLLDCATAAVLEVWGDIRSAEVIHNQVAAYVGAMLAAQANRVEAQPQRVKPQRNVINGGFGFGGRRGRY